MRYKPKKEIDGVIYYQCNKCKEWFSKDGFYADKRCSLGITSSCKKCHCKTTVEIRVLLTEKVTYSKELNAEEIAQFKTIQKAHPDWDEDECAKELWNSGKLHDFENDEIIEQETTEISASILKKYRKNG